MGRPETVVRWHRRGWRLVRRWRSRGPIGRPRLGAEVRDLIARMARENPTWGAERIGGELLKRGIAVGTASGRRDRRRGPACPPEQSWRPFLRNHRRSIRASDLLRAQTPTCRTLGVLVVVSRARRELVQVDVAASPTAARVWRQLIAATPWGRAPRYPIRDREAVDGGDVVRRARSLGITALPPPVRAPRANAIAERLVGPLRRACLDHMIVVTAQHLRAVPTEVVRVYNHARPDRALALETPTPLAGARAGPIRSRPVLGGLHHAYERAA